MSLTVVSIPIGNEKDLTERAKETLSGAQVIICEERRPAETFLKRLGLLPKEIIELNEHSRQSDVSELVKVCAQKEVALISDCGTPGFCDPGADLVRACQTAEVSVGVNPGASSLMAFISLSGEKLNRFHFEGFLPAEKDSRRKRIAEIGKIKDPVILLDTPYRLKSTLIDLLEGGLSDRQAVLGVNLTFPNQELVRGSLKKLAQKDLGKNPFILMVLP